MRLRIRVRLLMALAVSMLALPSVTGIVLGARPQSGTLTAVYHTNTGGKTQIIVKGSAPITYNIEREDGRTIWISMPGMAGNALLPVYKIDAGAVSTIQVVRTRGGSAAPFTRMKINLTRASDIVPVVRENLLILNIVPQSPNQTAVASPRVAQSGATSVRNISVARDEQNKNVVRATIETNGKPEYQAFVTPESNRIVVDIKGTKDEVSKKLFVVNSSNLQSIKVGQYKSTDPKVTRVVFELAKAAPYDISVDGTNIRVSVTEPVAAAATPGKAEIALASSQYSQTVPAANPVGVSAQQDLRPPQTPSAPPHEAAPTEPAPPAPVSSNQPEQQKTAPREEPRNVPANKEHEEQNKDAASAARSEATVADHRQEKRSEPVLLRPAETSTPAPAAQKPAPQPSADTPSNTSKKTLRGEAAETVEGTQGIGLKVRISGETANPAKPSVYEVGKTAENQSPSAASPTSAASAVNESYGSQNYLGDPISLDLKQIDVRDVARYISSTYGVNFVFDKSVGQVPVTISINEVPWNQAFDAILRANDLASSVEGSLIRVVTTTKLEQEETQKKKLRDARIMAEPLVTKLIRLQYEQVDSSGAGGQSSRASSSDASDTASSSSGGGGSSVGVRAIVSSRLSPRGRVEIDPRTNTLVVTDVAEHVKAVEEIISQLDRPERQVEIELRIVRVNHDFSRDLGVQLSAVSANPRRGGSYGISTLQPVPGTTANAQIGPQPLTQLLTGIPGAPLPSGSLGATAAASVIGLTTGVFGTNAITNLLTAAEQRGTANIISSPRVTAQNNRTAEIERGVRIPVQTLSNNTISTIFVTAALRLQIKPQITDNGEVVLHLIAENDAPDFSRQVLGIPTIATQRAETLVRLPDGGTTIFGGVSIDTDTRTEFRTPGLGRIPVLGELFKRRESGRSTDEILFFLTPRIFKPELVGLQDLLPLGKDEKKDK